MSEDFVTKDQIVKKLNQVKELVAIQKPVDKRIIRILYKIEELTWELGCCVKNIKQIARIQKQIACLFEDCFDVLGSRQFDEVRAYIVKLNKVATIFEEIVVREMSGESLLDTFTELGYDPLKYSPTYELL